VSFFSKWFPARRRSVRDLSEADLRGIGERVRATIAKRRLEALARIQDGFTYDGRGREGSIYFKEGDKLLDFEWEMSGVPRFDILLYGLNASSWTLPKGVPIPIAKQLELLTRLRVFLAGMKIKTDIDLPVDLSESKEPCMWSGCGQRSLQASMYCRHHLDLVYLAANNQIKPNQSSEPTLASVTPPAGQESRPR